jgi:hypothetical protein
MRVALLLAAAAAAQAQSWTQRGFLETTGLFFPQTAPGDSGRAVGEMLLRWEASYTLAPGLKIHGGLDARTDTHGMTERDWGLSWWDRSRQRPALAVRRLSGVYSRGRLTVEVGKQFVRWGKTDVLNPTDRFAPRDFVNVIDNDFLAVTAARVTYGTQSDTVDVVVEPRLTPSRVPLLGQRWAVLPADVPIVEEAPRFPGGAQFGARWNHIGGVAEYSLSFYNGYDHLPQFGAELRLPVTVYRYYPQMRMYGGDAAVPLKWAVVKAEAGYFTSSDARADEYALYVVQLERMVGEWSFIGGYAGQAVTRRGAGGEFSPVRGATRALVGRAGYTIDTNRSVSCEMVVRQNGAGWYVKPEYTQAVGGHWRVTVGVAVIRGEAGDFLGQYRRNSHGIVGVRYSF